MERLLGRAAFAGVQVQHVVEKVEGRRRDAAEDRKGSVRNGPTPPRMLRNSSDSQGELLPQAPPVLFLWFHGVEEGKLYHVRPDGGTGTPTDPAGRQKRVYGRKGENA